MSEATFTEEEARTAAGNLREADRRGLCERPGSGNFSSAVWHRLMDAGLMDVHFHPTARGRQVRAVLGVKE